MLSIFRITKIATVQNLNNFKEYSINNHTKMKMKLTNLLIIVLSAILIYGCKGEEFSSDLIPVQTNDGYIFINQKGETVIKSAQHLISATFFYEGISLVEIKDESSSILQSTMTYMNTKGEFVTNKKYKNATLFSEGIAWCVEENGYPTAINKKGETVFVLKNCEKAVIFSEGLAPVCFIENGSEKWGYANNKGEIIIPPTFDNCNGFINGLAPATIDQTEGHGYINKKGEFVIQPQFSDADMFNNNGLAIVAIGDQDRKYGVIDKSGTYVISPQYDRIVVDGDIFIVENSNLYGWVDSKGKTIINPQFKNLAPFGKSTVTSASIDGKKFGLIDKKGIYILNPQYETIFTFIGDIAPFEMDNKYGFLDKKGKIIINPQFANVANEYMGSAIGYRYSKLFTVQTDYCDIESICENLVINSNQNTFRGVEKNATFANIKSQYSNLSYESLFARRYSRTIDLGNGLSIQHIIFKFPSELSKTTYNYYDNQYETIEANDEKIATATYSLHIDPYSRAKNKGLSIAKEIAKAIKSKCNITAEIENNIGDEIEISLKSSEMDISIVGSESRITITVSFDK